MFVTSNIHYEFEVTSGLLVFVDDRCSCVSFFFFQAEDGIRDVERSRGLGDVYKRQDYRGIASPTPAPVIWEPDISGSGST